MSAGELEKREPAASRRDLLKATGITLLGISGAVPIVATRLAKRSAAEEAAPAPTGTRWGLVLDGDKCEACTQRDACTQACHIEHNVPNWEDTDDEIKWLWHEPLEHVFPGRVNTYSSEELRKRPTLVLCNHCEHPPCVKVCPTQATFKREDGPVMMDQHRCIGCRYCIVGCPYGSRSFNFKDPRGYFRDNPDAPVNNDFPTRTKGVVEKCTLCVDRIAEGREPACVEACHAQGGGGLIFGDLSDPESEVRKIVESRLTAQRKVELGTNPQVFYTL